MKQSIRLTRATLYFKFMAFRDLTSVRAGATPQRMFEKRKRHGETDVKVLPWSQWFFLIFWAFIVHCNTGKFGPFTDFKKVNQIFVKCLHFLCKLRCL